MASTLRDIINEKIDRIRHELKSIEKVLHVSWVLYPIPPKKNIDDVLSKIDTLNDDIIHIGRALTDSPDASLLESFGPDVSALGREMDIFLQVIQDVVYPDADFDPSNNPRTAVSQFAEITKEFASIEKILDYISLLHRDEIRAILSPMRRRKSLYSRNLRNLARIISLPENSALFDQFNDTILELFDKSKLIVRKMESLGEEHLLNDLDDEGRETLTEPRPSDEATPAQATPDMSDVASLREKILKATDEKQLSKTILIYVDALDTTSAFLARDRRNLSHDQDRVLKRSLAQFEDNYEIVEHKTYMQRYEGRLMEREDALQTLREEIETRVGEAEELMVNMKDLKPLLKKHGRRRKLAFRK
ncbi:hypothetical protein BLS_004823 [Venturia inaequalis]|uniref:Uncharacterized protein n=1 Tax=Venturia inaequalis TaxID=5025 RepID=A0A8H3VA35_VENIN|nr:hypothetical protein BLS_004823 [Venturia inaequalis]